MYSGKIAVPPGGGGIRKTLLKDIAILQILNPLRNNYVDAERQQFELNEISFDQAKINIRFEKNDIPILAELLGLPEQIRTGTRNNVDRTTALCILLSEASLKDFGLSPQSLLQLLILQGKSYRKLES
jgi:hypothetical protein